MKKFGFLVPVAAAAAALSAHVEAKIAPASSGAEPTTASAIPTVDAPNGMKEQFYIKNGERHSLMMKPSASGQMLAWHSSHASHESHSSHSSHHSHRSGY